MCFKIPSPLLPSCFSHSWGCSLRGFFLSRGSSVWFLMLPWCAVPSDLAYQTTVCSVQLTEMFRWRFCHQVQGHGSRAFGRRLLWRAEAMFHLQCGCSLGGRSEGFAALAISCAGCWLPARAGLLFQAAGLCLKGTVLAGRMRCRALCRVKTHGLSSPRNCVFMIL